MATLMLVNPRKRRKRSKARSNPSARRRKRRSAKRNPIFNLLGKKRRRSSGSGRKRRRKMRRNPISVRGTVSSIRSTIPAVLKPATLAAVGALSLDVIWSYLPIPANIKTGQYRHLAKAAGAIGLGVLGAKILGRDTAIKFATGAMTVVLYGVLRDFVSQRLPQVRLDGADFPALSYVSSGQNALGMYDYQSNAEMNPQAMSMASTMLGDPGLSDNDTLGIYD